MAKTKPTPALAPQLARLAQPAARPMEGYEIGDRVVTPSGKVGFVQPPPWNMPKHVLVEMLDGSVRWVLKELLLKD